MVRGALGWLIRRLTPGRSESSEQPQTVIGDRATPQTLEGQKPSEPPAAEGDGKNGVGEAGGRKKRRPRGKRGRRKKKSPKGKSPSPSDLKSADRVNGVTPYKGATTSLPENPRP